MNNFVKKIEESVKSCNCILLGDAQDQGHPFKNIDSLNVFCAEFLQLANILQTFLTTSADKSIIDSNVHIEMIFLCLTQVTTCIRHLERTINAEMASGTTLASSRQHFVDRMQWCLQRLHASLQIVAEDPVASAHVPLKEHTFVELLDMVLDCLSTYSDYKTGSEENSLERSQISKDGKQALVDCKEIRDIVDLLLSHALAFANVALPADKKALRTLCQKMFTECVAFEKECALNLNESDRKLRATSLENAIFHIETVINEALLRLVFTCFLDVDVISVEKVRKVICNSDPDDSSVYDLIDDFDANVDRITQIGIFAIAFAPDVKTRTLVRSCLASLESLDAYLVPALQSTRGRSNDIHSELLEQHYNEEMAVFMRAILEIIDSQAFISSYLELLRECLRSMEKRFHKLQLEEMLKMGEFLLQHFRIKSNYDEIVAQANSNKCRLFEKFVLILGECRAILMCADQVDHKRIIKRFKILSSILTKFRDSLSQAPACLAPTNIAKVTKAADLRTSSQDTIESIGIASSKRSILYSKAESMRCQAAKATVRIKKALHANLVQPLNAAATKEKRCRHNMNSNENICRRESLRTTMFKRQQAKFLLANENVQEDNAAESHIDEIVSQLKQNFTSQ